MHEAHSRDGWSAHLLELVHEHGVVRAFEVQEPAAVRCDSVELGNCVLRILLPGARKSNWKRCAKRDAAQGHSRSDQPWNLCDIRFDRVQTEAHDESIRGVCSDYLRSLFGGEEVARLFALTVDSHRTGGRENVDNFRVGKSIDSMRNVGGKNHHLAAAHFHFPEFPGTYCAESPTHVSG